MKEHHPTRRTFLKQTALTGLAASFSPRFQLPSVNQPEIDKQKTDHLVFLFQGDSITDGNRGRNTDPNHIMGHGYAFSIASRVGATFPQKDFHFYNRGISGNTVPDLAARWKEDTLNLKPDVLSILVGINDVDKAIQQKDQHATRTYEEGYQSLLDQTKTQLPNCLLVLCEPFIAPVGKVKVDWDHWLQQVQEMQAAVQRLSKEYAAVFVPLQKVFDEAAKKAPADYWIWDGIHPTVAGHELITRQWLKEVSKSLHFLKKLI